MNEHLIQKNYKHLKVDNFNIMNASLFKSDNVCKKEQK